jgi:hypothetical protein
MDFSSHFSMADHMDPFFVAYRRVIPIPMGDFSAWGWQQATCRQLSSEIHSFFGKNTSLYYTMFLLVETIN